MSAHTRSSSPSSCRESTAEPNTEQLANPGARRGGENSRARNSSVRYLRACDNCRRRKVKCDGGKPSCAHCNRVEAPCHYSIKPKSRRMWKCLENTESSSPQPVSATVVGEGVMDSTTARLMARVETMERLLMQRNSGRASTPRISADDNGARNQAAETAPGVGLFAALSAGTSGNSVVSAKRNSDSGPGNASTGNGDYFSSADPHRGTPPSSATAAGSLAAGFTMPSAEIINDLVDSLFSSNCNTIELLHEKTYRRQLAAGTMSPLLMYSSLASAARYSKHPAVRTDPPYSASTGFINKAKTLVVDAIEDPSLGNAQGLMIMCMMNFSLGNESVATFYRAMALNMCIVMGYNRLDSINGPVQPANNCGQGFSAATAMAMDWVELEGARRLWWTIFSIENYASVCMGLAPSIQAEYCNVNLPATTLEWERGVPMSSGADGDAPSSKRSRIAQNPLHQLPAYHAQLSLIFSKVAWLVTRTNSDSEDAVAEFGKLNSVLTRWYEGLPKELMLNSVDTLLYGNQNSSDHHDICLLHMRFYTTIIQLNHAIPEFTDDPGIIEPGQRKCVMSASRISDLLRASFEIPVEFRDMNWYMCVFRAAHIHIYRLLSRDTESIDRAKQDLAIHRRHLREGGPLWRICYKLLSRLDDMEQMVMLLPAQIPVADLVRLKNLTRKGKSQLVNMQLDSLIKPNLYQTENGDSDDMPLLARASMASGQSQQKQQIQQQQQQHTGCSLGAFLDSPVCSSMGGAVPSTNSFAPIPTTLGSLGMVQPGIPASISSATNFLPPSFSQHSLSQLPALTSLTSSSMHVPVGEMAPINTNIVIDNNMAETLVNYFYMVASNQSQGSETQSHKSVRSGSTLSLNSPPIFNSANGQMSTLMTSVGTNASPLQQQQQQHNPQFMTIGNGELINQIHNQQPTPMSYSGFQQQPQHLQQQQQQQQSQGIFGQMYDPTELQNIADNARSFV
ncbi:hypothetical protein LPJ66_001899 [Kickxella alabastrina]|uniref:Uncharacterized protein n=1 Tax=Kickxella alabastrina TaxID=61397 RepID=A0ACC1IRW7_9FUNG|nr:hypothetical protein LPJ66_001899 [Kickxella alabastrina]